MLLHLQLLDESLGEERQRAAAVGEDPADVGYFCDMPLKTRCAMVRVESVAYSIEPAGMPATTSPQQFGASGCT